MSRPSIIANIKSGAALAAVNGIRETLNWVFKWVANVTAGKGVKIDDKDGDYPKIEANIEAGDGVDIEEHYGALRISASGGKVAVTGTDGSYASGSSITFASASDSNVVATVNGSDDTITVTLGVYYT